MGLEEDLDSLVRLISNVTESFTTAIFLLDPEVGLLRLKANHSLSENVIPTVSIPVGQGMIGWVAQNRQPLHATHFQHDTTTLQMYRTNEEIKSFLAVPIQSREVLGVLCIDSKKQYVFTPKTQKILGNFAEHLARMVEKDRRGQMQTARMVEVSTLREFTRSTQKAGSRSAFLALLCSLPQELVNHRGCAVIWADPAGKRWVLAGSQGIPLPAKAELEVVPEQSLCGWVLRHNQILYLPELREDREFPVHLFTPREPRLAARSFLGAPLSTPEEILGMICLTGDCPNYFTPYDQEVASLVASQVSTVLAHFLIREKWERLAVRDSLTGVANYRAFEESLDAALASVNRRQEVSVLIVDLDKFCQINKRLGYPVGDEVLRQVARRLQSFTGPEDTLARLGADRFALILQKCPLEQGLLTGEKIRKLFEESLLPALHRDVHTTVSVGVASYPNGICAMSELLKVALKRVSAAKSAGGNVVQGS
ncbi:MAG: diguanylate cyclase [Candidatus Tectomicrobia bacterium]|uniref:diguanylate cyclase n=1 Tax=Tectimicrobiota bacterium TaxID=2528274 RepID=A0A932LZH5_UNCTE|nr:diguanylate cyclase [Candidatus Tectomicrobia bacterium]